MQTTLAIVLAFTMFTTPLLPHGGQYQGPADSSTGSASPGSTVGPPTNPGGSAAPGSGAGTGGNLATAGPRTSRNSGARGGADRGTQTTSGEGLIETRGFEAWEFWWESNKDAFLDLKARLGDRTIVSGSTIALTGKGKKMPGSGTRRPSRSLVETDIIPAMLELARHSTDGDIVDSAILALGRTSGDDTASLVLESAVPLLAHRELSVRSSTVLALGVLGSPAAVPTLQDILQDSTRGRALTGGGSVHWLSRAFAALSLGLIGDATSTVVLKDTILRLGDKNSDIKVCAIVALGLATGSEQPAATDFLVELLNDKRMDPTIASYIPTSLGRLGDARAVQPLLEVFMNRDSDNLLVQSAAIGLGQLAGMTDQAVVDALIDYVQQGKDQQARHFALIALARIGARDEEAADHAEGHTRLRSVLAREIDKKGKSKDHRSWAALAGALYAGADAERRAFFIERIEVAYMKESNPSYLSAFAVALGLLDDTSFAPQILEDFNTRKESDFRGYAAVALGFLGSTEASDALRGLCQSKATPPTLRLQAATGLGLMRDPRAVDTLIGTMETATTLGVSSAVARALGLIGDRDSIAPLVRIAQDEDTQALTRAFACVALGLVGEKTDLPWNARIKAGNNYRAKVPSMAEVLDIL